MDRQAKGMGLLLCTILVLALSCTAQAADPSKILRVAIPDIDTLDPLSSDDYSELVSGAIFEGLYEWDYLARPTKLAPNTAAALPDITDGGLTWTIRVKPGIYFTDDPAFKGKPRELVAEDYVYSFKRLLDPTVRMSGGPLADLVADARAAVDAARKPDAKFDYDRPLRGLKSLDRYTLQLRLNQVNYPAVKSLIVFVSAVAREVVEAAGGNIQARAVGTGPYRLKEWKRGSRIVLEANPNYRTISFPLSTDREQAELVHSMERKSLPQIGGVEISLINEDLPKLLEFEGIRLDYVELTGAVPDRLLLNGKLTPTYISRGVRHHAFPTTNLSAVYFNMNDPVVGGLDPQRIALRRAIALGLDVNALIKMVYGGQALPATQLVPPGVTGHDPAITIKSRYDSAAANALLDRFGYGKRDADGFRLAPDGKRLTLAYGTLRATGARDAEALWKKNMDAIGLRMQFHEAPFQDLMKEADAGHFQMFARGFGGSPSGWLVLAQLYSKEAPFLNASRFRLPEYDKAMEQFARATTEPDQVAAARKMSELAQYYAPIIPTTYRLNNDFVQPWVMGFYPSAFEFGNYWKYLDIDLAWRRQLPRIGILEWADCPATSAPYLQALLDLGYVEGSNVAFECRWAHGNNDGLMQAANELIGRKVDVIFAPSEPLAKAAREATRAIPIVMLASGDPVSAGLASSLGRPEGNVTGLTYYAAGLTSKRLEFLKEALPGVSRIAVLSGPTIGSASFLAETQAAAKSLGLQVQVANLDRVGDLPRAFSEFVQGRAQALFVLPDPLLADEAAQIAQLALANKLPTIAWDSWCARDRCLITYSGKLDSMSQRLALYTDKILKGAKPADLPIEQPKQFSLVINLRIAKSLGLTIPQSLLARADEVISDPSVGRDRGRDGGD